MKKLGFIFVLAIATIACKNEKKEDITNSDEVKEQVAPAEEKKDNITITVSAIVPNDDEFVIHYTEEEGFNFNGKDKILIDIKGSESAQDIVFDLPEKVLPANIMFKVGQNNPKDVTINYITFDNNNGSAFEISKDLFFQFFNPNKFIDFNRENNTFTSKEIEGKHEPTFFARPGLIQKIEEEM